MSRRMRVALALAAVGVLLGLAVAATRIGALQGTVGGGGARERPAPELTGIAGWINSDPFTLQARRGTVVLIDFWTYSCVNCVRTFPHLRALYSRYHSFGLEIVGVHSPEFEFEKDRANIAAAVKRYRLPYPVAMDNDMATWRAFENNYWPHVYLIDARGRIRFDWIGEGGEDEIQSNVRTLLSEAGARLPAPVTLEDTQPSRGITPEIYAGRERGSVQSSLANPEGFALPNQVLHYAPVPASRVADLGTEGSFLIEGSWSAEDEYVEAADNAAVVLRFHAKNVFVVAEAPEGVGPVRVLLDGRRIVPGAAGADVRDGSVVVGRSDLYRLVALPEPQTHTLRLEVPVGFRLYTFTFG